MINPNEPATAPDDWDTATDEPSPSTIPTPWDSLTDALPYEGWRRGKITLVAARTENGLTTMGLEAARHASALGHRVLIFSLRYAPRTLQARMIASRASIPFGKVVGALENPGEVDADAGARIEAARRELANVEIRRPDAGFGQQAFEYELTHVRPHPGPSLVVIDSVTSMRPDPVYDNNHDNRAEMYKRLFFATRKSEFSMLALARIPGRHCEKPPVVNDLAEADDALYGVAGQTMLLHRHRSDERYGELDVLIPAVDWTFNRAITLAFREQYPSIVGL